jgi:hypothetical protein
MNSIYKNNLVFATTREKAITFLEKLIGEIRYKDIKHIWKSDKQGELEVELKDGTTYKVVSASDNSRGYRCDKAYVEKSVDKEIIDCIIKPILCYSIEKEQIVYFD